jgi:hypothetical protein
MPTEDPTACDLCGATEVGACISWHACHERAKKRMAGLQATLGKLRCILGKEGTDDDLLDAARAMRQRAYPDSVDVPEREESADNREARQLLDFLVMYIAESWEDDEVRDPVHALGQVRRLVNAPLAGPDRIRLWAHCISEHAVIMSPEASEADLKDYHDHEHEGPGTIRNHPLASRAYTLKKIGVVLSEAEPGDFDRPYP